MSAIFQTDYSHIYKNSSKSAESLRIYNMMEFSNFHYYCQCVKHRKQSAILKPFLYC